MEMDLFFCGKPQRPIAVYFQVPFLQLLHLSSGRFYAPPLLPLQTNLPLLRMSRPDSPVLLPQPVAPHTLSSHSQGPPPQVISTAVVRTTSGRYPRHRKLLLEWACRILTP